MNEAIRTSAESAKVAAAYVKAYATIGPAKKDSTNPHFKSRFASLQACFEACNAGLRENGLAPMQAITEAADGVHVTTRLIHESGEWIEAGPAFFPASKHDAQGFGSASTYGKRYALTAMLGIVADDDDDGNAATASAPKRKEPKVDQPDAHLSARGASAGEAFLALDVSEQEAMRRKAQLLEETYEAKGIGEAVNTFEQFGLDTEGQLAIWFVMDSGIRNRIKEERRRRRETVKEAA